MEELAKGEREYRVTIEREGQELQPWWGTYRNCWTLAYRVLRWGDWARTNTGELKGLQLEKGEEVTLTIKRLR